MSYEKLDFTLTTAEERIKYIQSLLSNPNVIFSPAQLTYFADYILGNQEDKAAKKARSRGIITNNRRATVEKREISFQGYVDLCSEQNKDEIYNHMINDRNLILSPRLQITEADVREIPGMAALKDAIAATKVKLENPDSPNRGRLLIQLIQLRKDQYILKEAYRKPLRFQRVSKSFSVVDLPQELSIGQDHSVTLERGFSLCDKSCVSIILQNYAHLRDLTEYQITSSAYYLLREFEDLVQKYVRQPYPQLYDLLVLKVDGLLGKTIADVLNDKYGVKTFTDSSISRAWRQKLPQIIAAGAQQEYLSWYYLNVQRGQYRTCRRCGQTKLASPRYFQRNSSNSADGFYSICKKCKNKAATPMRPRKGWNGAHGL